VKNIRQKNIDKDIKNNEWMNIYHKTKFAGKILFCGAEEKAGLLF